VKTYIDMMALHNMNRFHWHITEDQGWRLEIKKYPKLTEIGSKRTETVIGRNSGEYDGKPYGGFYTQEQAKEIVAYAAERYITVIPLDRFRHKAHLLIHPIVSILRTGHRYIPIRDKRQLQNIFM